MLREKTELIGAKAIAEYLELSSTTVYRLFADRHNNGIPIYDTLGGSYRSTEEDLDDWRERQMAHAGVMATDLLVTACSREYVVIERQGLLEELSSGELGRWDMPYEALVCLRESARQASEGEQALALRAAARAVGALEVWGDALRGETPPCTSGDSESASIFDNDDTPG